GPECSSQTRVVGEARIIKGLREADLRSLVHLLVLTVPGMDSNHTGLTAHGLGVFWRSAERLGPVGSQPFRVLGMIAVRESVAHDRVGQASGVPSARQVKKSLAPACDLVNRWCHLLPPSPPNARLSCQGRVQDVEARKTRMATRGSALLCCATGR